MSALMKFSLSMAAIVWLSTFVLGSIYGFSFPPVEEYAGTIILVALFGSIASFYTFVRSEKIISSPCWSITVYALFIPPAVMFTQVMGALNFPMIDPQLAAIDQAMGFNWLSAVEAFSKLPDWVSTYSTLVYDSTIYCTVLVAALLIFTGKHHRLDEFVTLFILTGIVTIISSGLIPAETAYEYFKPDAAIIERLSPIVGQDYMRDFYALRDGSLRELKLIETRGIVSFPSFHTIHALLLIYATRNFGPIFAFIAVWNIGVILATPFDGAHYLTDVIAGGLVFVLAAYLVRWLEPHLENMFSRHTTKPQFVPQPQ